MAADLLLPPLYWSLTEASLAVVAACLPTLGPLFPIFRWKKSSAVSAALYH